MPARSFAAIASAHRPARAVLLVVAVAVAVLLLRVPASGSAEGTDVRVSSERFAVALEIDERELTTLGGTAAPLVYWTTDGARHSVTNILGRKARGATTTYTVATDDPNRRAAISVTRKANGLRITYALDDSKAVAALGFSMTAPARARFLGTGQRVDWVGLQRTVQPLKVFNSCTSSSPSPFFVSTAGFGAWVSTTAIGRIAFPGAVDDTNFACDLGTPPCSVGPPANAVRWCFKASSVTITIAHGSPAELLTAHARAVGLPRAPWLPQLGLIKWRDRIAGPDELFDDIAQLRSRDIPIGWVLLDNPWERGAAIGGCYGALSFDPKTYPDPEGMIKKIHDQGVRFMLWISPQARRENCASLGYPDGWLTGDDKTVVRDLTMPKVRDDFIHRLQQLVALGVDGFKGDRGDEVNLESNTLAGGTGATVQNLFPLLYDRAAAAAFAPTHGKQFATLFRSAVPGSSSVLPGFVGPDAEHSFNGLRGSIRAAQTAGVSGLPVWGSDVGGYAGGIVTPTLFVRWAQFAALTPIFEVGGAGANATFWQLGPYAVRGLREAAELHYELVPYLYALAQEASRNGLPVVRPLGLTWPDDGRAWGSSLELTVGDTLLAAPVTTDGSSSSVYLPAGTWIDLFTGARHTGGRSTTRASGAYDFPLYLRAGSALPFNSRSPGVWRDAWKTDDLLRDVRQGWLVGAGVGTASRSVASQGARLTATTSASGRTTVTVTHALREQQLLVFPARPACGVTLGGVRLARVSLASLPQARSAWARQGKQIVIKSSVSPKILQLEILPCAISA